MLSPLYFLMWLCACSSTLGGHPFLMPAASEAGLPSEVLDKSIDVAVGGQTME